MSYEIFKDSFLCSDKKSQLPYDVFNDAFLYSDKNTKTVVKVFSSFRKKVVGFKSGVSKLTINRKVKS